MKHRPIMIQGCHSSAGKTFLVSALCRHFANKGISVAPFKSQNMSLNSFANLEGKEIALATKMQAEAAKMMPNEHMNPLLLKPKNDIESQLIIHGKPHSDVTVDDYFKTDRLQELKWGSIDTSLAHLSSQKDLLIIEGAGSCAEPNLREWDVVNMGLAHRVDARVIIVVDIDRGGAFAHLIGSLEVMKRTEPKDVNLVEGFILNRFRGDRGLLDQAIKFLEKETGKPVVGVVPFTNSLLLDDEDSLVETPCDQPEIDIAIIYLPHISNTSDFSLLALEEGVRVRYVRHPSQLGCPDLIIIPGTKSTTWDLQHLKQIGFDRALKNHLGKTPILGVCGGYQMLGANLIDKDKRESKWGTVKGLGFLTFDVVYQKEKVIVQRNYKPADSHPFSNSKEIIGYELRHGEICGNLNAPLYIFENGKVEGSIDAKKMVMGTHIHDILSNGSSVRELINYLRGNKGLVLLKGDEIDHYKKKEQSLNKLAALIKNYTNISL